MIDENKGLVIVSVGSIGMGIIGVKVNKWKWIKREIIKGEDKGNRGIGKVVKMVVWGLGDWRIKRKEGKLRK